MARKWWLGTSWKMNGTLKDARAFAGALRAASLPANVLPFVIPSFTAIATVREVLPKGGPVLVGAQNTHWCDSGAWTGEVSPAQLADVGCDLVEVGHSERRGAFGDSDETVNLKVHAILRHGMIPLVCFGESRQVLDGGGPALTCRNRSPQPLMVSSTPRTCCWRTSPSGRSERRGDQRPLTRSARHWSRCGTSGRAASGACCTGAR